MAMATIMIDEGCGHCVRRWAEVVMVIENLRTRMIIKLD